MAKQKFYDSFSNLILKCWQSGKNFYLAMSVVTVAGSQTQNLILKSTVKWQGSYRNRKSKFKDFSRTFQGLFTFFQESFFMDSNSPNTAYTQDFCPIKDRKRISLASSLFLPDFSSVYCLRTLLSFLPFPISAL